MPGNFRHFFSSFWLPVQTLFEKLLNLNYLNCRMTFKKASLAYYNLLTNKL